MSEKTGTLTKQYKGIRGGKGIAFYYNKDRLFEFDVVCGIDDRDRSYDDTRERMELEETAKRLFE